MMFQASQFDHNTITEFQMSFKPKFMTQVELSPFVVLPTNWKYVVLGITGHDTHNPQPIIITNHSSLNTVHTPLSHFIRATQPHDFILHSHVTIQSCIPLHNTCTNVFIHKLHLSYHRHSCFHNISFFNLSLHSYQIFLTSVYRGSSCRFQSVRFMQYYIIP